jgi:hypothetical protein
MFPMARTISLSSFTARIRDDASRFRLDYERAMSRHRGLLVGEQTLDAWLQAFAAWLRAETEERRADSIEQTVRRRRR